MTKKWIFVLGMHRSGTSALSGELAAQGICFGNDFIDDIIDVNAKGFFENRELVAINEALLAHLKLSWFDCFFSGYFHDPESINIPTELEERMQQLLCSEQFSDTSWNGLKDPRLSLLLPFWLKQLHVLGHFVKVIIMNRNSDEIAKSLYKRDRMTALHAYLLWHQHTLTAVHYSNTCDRVWVDYHELMFSTAQVLQKIVTALDLPLSLQEVSFVDAKISSNLSMTASLYPLCQTISTTNNPLIDINWDSEWQQWQQYLQQNQVLITGLINAFHQIHQYIITALDIGEMHTQACQLISKRDQQLQATNAQVTYCENVIVERDQQLQATNAQVTYCENVIAERDQLLKQTNERINDAAVYIAKLEAGNQALQQQLHTGWLRKAAFHIENIGNKK